MVGYRIQYGKEKKIFKNEDVKVEKSHSSDQMKN